MVCVGVSALPSISPVARVARRVQRQVHVEPMGRARWFVRDACGPRARDLSQLLLSARPLAIPRHSPREGRLAARGAGTGAFIAPPPHLSIEGVRPCVKVRVPRSRTARRRASPRTANTSGRPHGTAKTSRTEVPLRRARLTTVRRDLLAARVLPHANGSGPTAHLRHGDRRIHRPLRRRARARRRLELEGAPPARLPRRPASYVPVDISAAYLASRPRKSPRRFRA